MKIGIDRIIGGEIAVLDDGASVGKIHKFLGVHEIGLRRSVKCVSVNVGIATVNRDVIPGDRDTILVAGFAAGSDLDRLVFWRFDINRAATPSSRKKKEKKDRCPRSHGAPARYRRAKVLQRRKGPSRTGLYALPGKAERSRPRRVSPPVCWLRPQASTNACELTGGFDDPGSVPVSKAFAAVMSCQKMEAPTLSPSAIFGE